MEKGVCGLRPRTTATCHFVSIAVIVLSILGPLLIALYTEAAPVDFDVRHHLSTSSRYEAGKSVNEEVEDPRIVPSDCVPIHLNLVARHGTRAPTKKRIKELEHLAERLQSLLLEVDRNQAADHPSPPSWIRGWKSPWEGRKVGGELLPQGEEEMYQLAQRLRNSFPEIFKDDYHPDIYPIIATQVARTSASAVAFGIGLFAGRGTLGPGKHRAFAVITDSRGHDIHLRFHDTCLAYKESKKLRKPAVAGLQEEVYELVAKGVRERYGLAVTSNDTASLWLLCKNEAALLNITDRACGLFTPEEVELLEWADDLEMHHLKGYGEAINYQMGVPLLEDVLGSMERTIAATEEPPSDSAVEKARMRFAHAETVIPFTCLLGLFGEGTDVKNVQAEQPLKVPLRPPHQRLWRGSLVAPFAANTALVLYKCPIGVENTGQDHALKSRFLVQALHNEKPVVMPACNGTYFCPFEVFKEHVAPYLKVSFESLCTVVTEPQPVKWSWSQMFASIRSFIFGRSQDFAKGRPCHSEL